MNSYSPALSIMAWRSIGHAHHMVDRVKVLLNRLQLFILRDPHQPIQRFPENAGVIF